MGKLLHGRDNGLKYSDLSLHSYHYASQNHSIFDSCFYLLVLIPLSPTGSY